MKLLYLLITLFCFKFCFPVQFQIQKISGTLFDLIIDDSRATASNKFSIQPYTSSSIVNLSNLTIGSTNDGNQTLSDLYLAENAMNINSIDLILRIGLFDSDQIPGTSGTNGLDGLLLQFNDQYSNCDDINDANKIFGPDENIFTNVDGENISIQSRLTPSGNFNEVIDLHFSNLNEPQYKLYFEFIIDSGLNKFTNGLFLWDKCEDTFTALSDLEVITFDENCTSSNSFVGERFALVFRENPVVNDNSFNAIELGIDETSAGDEFTMVEATAENNEPFLALNDGINGSVWFSFIAPGTSNVKVSTDIPGGTASDTEIAVYSYDNSCSAELTSFSLVGYDDNSGTVVANRSILYLENLTPGDRYFIQVDKSSVSSAGTFGIELSSFTVFTYSTAEGYLPFNPDGQSLGESILFVEDGIAILDQNTSLRNITVEPAGALSLNADLNSNIVFKSNAFGSGQLSQSTTSSITGKTTVERFIPAGDNNKRAYRLLTSAVNSTGTIFNNWQENGSTPSSPNGLGIQITGGVAANGFDQSGSNNPSMFTFDNSNANATSSQDDDWSVLPNTNVKGLKAGEAYLTFVRGDRSIDLTSNSATPTNTTLRAIGNLHIGPKSFDSSNNLNSPEFGLSNQALFYSLVGNPYQAIVDFREITLSNVNPFFYWVWDPNVGVRGNYVTLDFTDVDPDVVTNNNSNSEANQYIQPGQSFFVQTIVDGPAGVTFNENDKDTSADPVTVFSEQSHPSLSLLFYTTSAFNSGDRESDGLVIKFRENANNNSDLMDADKFFGSDENLARLNGSKYISIENRDMPTDAEVLPLSTTGYTEDNYTFIANAANVQGNFEAYLLDNYTGTQTQLNEGATQVNYSVDNNIPGSIASDRFSIIFDNTTLGVGDNTFGAGFNLYPNPTKDGHFSIKTPNLSGEVKVKLNDMLGQMVLNETLTIVGNEVNVKAIGLSIGVYIVELSQDEQTFTTKLIVK